MPPKPSLNVSLTPHLEQFIAASVASGRYQTASEVVRAALRLLERLEAGEPQSGAAKNAYPRRGTTLGDGKTSKPSLDDSSDGFGERVKKGTGHGSVAKVPRHA